MPSQETQFKKLSPEEIPAVLFCQVWPNKFRARLAVLARYWIVENIHNYGPWDFDRIMPDLKAYLAQQSHVQHASVRIFTRLEMDDSRGGSRNTLYVYARNHNWPVLEVREPVDWPLHCRIFNKRVDLLPFVQKYPKLWVYQREVETLTWKQFLCAFMPDTVLAKGVGFCRQVLLLQDERYLRRMIVKHIMPQFKKQSDGTWARIHPEIL